MIKQIIFLLFPVIMFAGPIHTGNLVVEEISENEYKMFLDSKPYNSLLHADSAALWVGVLCSNGQYESRQIGWRDTLYYNFYGNVTIATSINWFRNGNKVGRTDMFTPNIFAGNDSDCYEFIGVNKFYSPVEQPPVFQPELTVTNGLIESNSGGVLVILNVDDWSVTVKEYVDEFQFQLGQGQWYVYLLVNGTQVGGHIIYVQ